MSVVDFVRVNVARALGMPREQAEAKLRTTSRGDRIAAQLFRTAFAPGGAGCDPQAVAVLVEQGVAHREWAAEPTSFLAACELARVLEGRTPWSVATLTRAAKDEACARMVEVLRLLGTGHEEAHGAVVRSLRMVADLPVAARYVRPPELARVRWFLQLAARVRRDSGVEVLLGHVLQGPGVKASPRGSGEARIATHGSSRSTVRARTWARSPAPKIQIAVDGEPMTVREAVGVQRALTRAIREAKSWRTGS